MFIAGPLGPSIGGECTPQPPARRDWQVGGPLLRPRRFPMCQPYASTRGAARHRTLGFPAVPVVSAI